MTKDRFRFRAWDPVKKEYYDEFFLMANGNGAIYSPVEEEGNEDRLIIEQCTGIKDANGKLVFEGDIIFINGEKWRVIWNDEDCAFFFSNLKEVYHQPIFPDFYTMASDFEVIGDIHENPELMK